MSSVRMATSSCMALVESLLRIVNEISALGEDVKSHKKSCWNLTRRIKLLAPLFEEIVEVRSPLPPAAVVVFQDMRTAFQSAKQLLEECSIGSRLYMVMERDCMAGSFLAINASLSRALDELPFDLMAVSDEIQEQAQLVKVQLKRTKPLEDAQEEQLHEDVMAVINSERDGMIDLGLLDPIIGKLGLNSLPSVLAEIEALEVERQKLLDEGKTSKNVNRAILMMRKLRVSFGGDYLNEDVVAVREREMGEEADADRLRKGEGPKMGGMGEGSSQSAPVPPEDFRCPISLEIMRDPVIVSTGQTYDRCYIEQWLKDGHKTCPKTQLVLVQPIVLIPNYSLRSIIHSWCKAHGVELPKKTSRMGPTMDAEGRGCGGCSEGEKALIMSLKEKLISEDADVQKAVASEVRMLAKKSMANRICIAEAGIIPLLVALLSSADLKTQEHAVTALLNLSIHDANKSDIVAARAIPVIVDVLKSGSMEARENAAAALFSLSVIDENKIAIGQAGAIPALVSLLKEGTTRGKKDAATALFNLSIYQGNKSRAVRAGIVEPLIGLLLDRRAGMTDEALAILAVLSSSPDGRNAIGETAAVPILVDLMSSGSPRNKENSASVLLSLCVNGVNHTRMAVEYNANAPLHVLLRNGTPRAKRKASQLLQHLQEHELHEGPIMESSRDGSRPMAVNHIGFKDPEL